MDGCWVGWRATARSWRTVLQQWMQLPLSWYYRQMCYVRCEETSYEPRRMVRVREVTSGMRPDNRFLSRPRRPQMGIISTYSRKYPEMRPSIRSGRQANFQSARGPSNDLSLTSGVGLTRSCGGFQKQKPAESPKTRVRRKIDTKSHKTKPSNKQNLLL